MSAVYAPDGVRWRDRRVARYDRPGRGGGWCCRVAWRRWRVEVTAVGSPLPGPTDQAVGAARGPWGRGGAGNTLWRALARRARGVRATRALMAAEASWRAYGSLEFRLDGRGRAGTAPETRRRHRSAGRRSAL